MPNHAQIATRAQDCPQCHGIGFLRVEGNAAAPCCCQHQAAIEARIRSAGFPAAFEAATFETFKHDGQNGTQYAYMIARRFVDEYVHGPCDLGLLFTGPVGTGKTHLAIAIARTLIETKGIFARFVDVRELLDRIRSSYDDETNETQEKIIRPVLTADLVIIDELGAARSSDWVFETQELLIGSLYNRRKTVIVTTNLANLPAGAAADESVYKRAARPDTLGDRIGSRMFSRLQQMCREVKIEAPDWRSRK